MNENEQELLDGLHALASDGPREAPPHVEQQLLSEFRRRSHRRRLRAWISATSVGAVAATVAVLLWIGPVHSKAPMNEPGVAAAVDEIAAGFYPLPDADALPPVENALVVRVELPLSSLQMIGVPVNGARAGERVEADVLLGQDGLARGIRLVE